MVDKTRRLYETFQEVCTECKKSQGQDPWVISIYKIKRKAPTAGDLKGMFCGVEWN